VSGYGDVVVIADQSSPGIAVEQTVLQSVLRARHRLPEMPDLHLNDCAVGEHLLVVKCERRLRHMAQDAIPSAMAPSAI